ncbi:MAG: malonate-semialdehyde dehydrogenase (acetylating) / methylmalonate-semialdehyde dehydrogenase [Solirubrobacterales bacterium]|jgi:malonate-semialdehyde dehydrogenase (acetylating)/methylmalonate-semialdehyde dehydrogenase|nr:malonate-semialdehyde dehydrogenase (acetylating) / methylmalonate-semialdehyde dehydrogenase [Solirubrobacterales bacterium]
METESATRTLRNYIGGGWVEAAGDGTLEDRNPATGELTAMVPLSGPADVDAAARAAREAFAGWRAEAVQKRARAVIALRAALWEHREELARLVTEDMGKTLTDARGEVLRGIESTEAACGIPHLLKGENLEGVGGGVDVELVRQPVGVVAAITPFNFPAMIPLWFLPYAVACGNTFILKPSERDPRPAELIFELIEGIDELPDGVLNLVHGAHGAVDGLLDHPEIDAISFVGQAKTARYIAERSAANGKRFQALGGAKNSLIVMPDADLDVTVPAIMSSAFGAGGQRCLAGSVAVLVGTRAEQDRALEALAEAAAGLGVGPGDRDGVEVCPLVGPEARDRIEAAIEAAAAGDDEVVLDGRRDPGPGGTLIGPSIVVTDDTQSALAREELFGPLLTVIRADDLDAALEFANGSRYGNAGSIFTTSGAAARAYRWGAQAGMLGVNVGVAAPVAWFPFSGWKDSIDGDLHANGRDAVEFYTRKKVVSSRW